MTDRATRQRRSMVRVGGFSAWVAVVALFLLWEAARYQGLMSLVGEWQFNAFGRHYATFNYLLLVTLLCLPGYLIFLRPRRQSGSERPENLLFRSARTFYTVLLGGAASLGAVALLMFVLILSLPRSSGPVQRIDLDRPSLTEPREGPTELLGSVIYERTAGFDEDMLVARHTFRFAPVLGARRDGTELRYFVQFPPVDGSRGANAVTLTGVLKRNGLPGEIVRLFRYAGYHLEDPHYVLFAETSAMRWPYLTTAVQLIIGALLVLGLALLQRHRLGRIDQRVHRDAIGDKPVGDQVNV